MTCVSDDRWTCPTCRVTEFLPAPLEECRDELVRIQLRHSRSHVAIPRPRRSGMIIEFPAHEDAGVSRRAS